MRLRARRVIPAGWWFDALLVAAFTALTLILAHAGLTSIDKSVASWVLRHQPWPLHWAARAGNLLGQGGFFTLACLVLAGFVGWKKRSVRPFLPVIMAFVLTFVSITYLKNLTDRAAPHSVVAHAERFGSGGVSYPSGHLANSIVWYGVLALLLTPWLAVRWRWVIRIVPPVVLSLTTVYLGFHWLSDTVGGILLGLFLWRLIARVPWDDLPLGRRLAAAGWDRPFLREPEATVDHEVSGGDAPSNHQLSS